MRPCIHLPLHDPHKTVLGKLSSGILASLCKPSVLWLKLYKKCCTYSVHPCVGHGHAAKCHMLHCQQFMWETMHIQHCTDKVKALVQQVLPCVGCPCVEYTSGIRMSSHPSKQQMLHVLVCIMQQRCSTKDLTMRQPPSRYVQCASYHQWLFH